MDDIQAMEAQRLFWESYPYGKYLNAVDAHLEQLIGRTSIQSELEFIAEMQEASALPLETAWAIAKESFYEPWKTE